MNSKPIIFNSESVRAILDGRKTQTRRVMKPVPPHGREFEYSLAPDKAIDKDNGLFWLVPDCVDDHDPSPAHVYEYSCPYGRPGDRLWVRETWACIGAGHVKPSEIAPGYTVHYGSDDIKKNWQVDKWRSPIHMPRWASRITLEVTAVRVERLQKISEADAIAEGVSPWFPSYDVYPGAVADYQKRGGSYRNGFHAAWDAINTKRGYPWKNNPWVWVIEFVKVADNG